MQNTEMETIVKENKLMLISRRIAMIRTSEMESDRRGGKDNMCDEEATGTNA